MARRAELKVRLKAYTLRTQGLTVDEIVGTLREEFGVQAVPDRSNVARWLKKWRESPPEELEEDEAFAWSTMSELPWEHSRGVLDAWHFHQESRRDEKVGPFTRRLAKWTWRVLNAMGLADEANSAAPRIPGTTRKRRDPGRRLTWPTDQDVAGVVQEYSWRETASVILGEEFQTRDLDMWLTFRPWHGRDWLDHYNATRDRLGLFEYVQWHVTDDEWLRQVAPTAVEGLRWDLFSRIGLDVGEEVGAGDFRKATDGLLRSQLVEYIAWDHLRAGLDVPPPKKVDLQWSLDYLSEVMASLSARGSKGGSE